MKRICVCVILTIVCLSVCLPVMAEMTKEEKQLFASKENYDIYYKAGNETLCLLEDVEVIDIKIIGDKQFLEYYSDSFGKISKKDSGYIDFHSITAIVPHKTEVSYAGKSSV